MARPIAVGCVATAAAARVATLDPSSARASPLCAVRSVTGWWCPGCGLTRATHHLMHGEIGQALGYNALVVPIVALLLLTWITWLVDPGGRRSPWMHRAAVPAWIALAVAALAFALLRNVPSFDAMRG